MDSGSGVAMTTAELVLPSWVILAGFFRVENQLRGNQIHGLTKAIFYFRRDYGGGSGNTSVNAERI